MSQGYYWGATQAPYDEDAVFYNDDAEETATDPVNKALYLRKSDVPGDHLR